MVLVRPMLIADYDAVINLWQQTEGLSIRDADSRERINDYLERNPALSFVALQQSTIVGAVLVGTDGRRGYLQHLAVCSACRGQSIGRRLVSASVDALATIGIAKSHLFVLDDNLSAQAFYQQLGWYPRDEVRMFSFNCSDNPSV